MNLDLIDWTRIPDIHGPPDATHIYFGPQGHLYWKVEKLYGFLYQHFMWDDKFEMWLKMGVMNDIP